MRAAVQERYGPPHELLRLREVPVPALGDRDVLVRVAAASVNPADWHLLRGEPRVARLQLGLRRPRATILGCDLAGRVERTGPGVTSLRPGDEVFGCSFMAGFGAFAELAAVPEERLVATPANASLEQAAAVPLAGMTALQALRDRGGVGPGQSVLVIGASGGVGTFAVQLAKWFGADVTAVCSGRNAELVESLGADRIIDHTRRDPLAGDRRYDLVLQVAGTASPSALRRLLVARGTLVAISGDSQGRWIGPVGRSIRTLMLAPLVRERLVVFTVKPNAEDLRFLRDRVAAGDVTPAIERTYPLDEIAAAIRHVEEGHTRGKVVVVSQTARPPAG
ncbi:MAG: NAD(P)-dependent alcohol dehydrogenase [Thermoleophilia bacterium]